MMNQPITVLLIAATPAELAQLRPLLSDALPQPHRLMEATGGGEGLRCWCAQPADYVLLVDHLPDMAALAQETGGNAPVILLTSSSDATVVRTALQHGAQDCLSTNHLTAFEVQRAIAHTSEKVRLRHALRQAESRLPTPPPDSGHGGTVPPDRLPDPDTHMDRYRLLFAHTRDSVLFIRPNGQIVDANPAAIASYGYDRATLCRKTIYDLRDPATAVLVAPHLALADQVGIRFETVHCRCDGTTFPVEVSAVGVDSDRERLLISVIRDISAHTRVEQDLRAREQFISAILHTMPHLIYVYDLIMGKTIFINDQIERICGSPLADLQALEGNLFLHLVHPRDRLGLQAHLDRLRHASPDAILEYEFRFYHRDGSWHWLSSRDQIFDYDDTGAVRTVLGIASDSTSRKQAEAQLHLFEQVVLNMNDALLITEADPIDEPGPRIVYANPAFTRMTGYTLDVVITDEGIGIPQDALPTLFQRFYRATNAQQQQIGGIGVGLYVVKEIVTRHGGEVHVQSTEGHGSTFTVCLPLALPEVTPRAEQP